MTFADIQQFAANVPAYLEGTRNFETDLMTAANAAINPFVPTDPEPYIYTSLDPTPSSISIDSFLGHLFDIPLPGKDGLLEILTDGLNVDLGITTINIPVLPLLVGGDEAAQIEPYLNFAGSPLSGILLGSLGSTFSPYLPIASLFLQDQAIAEAIGWDGVGQPLAHLFTELTAIFN